MTASDGTGMSGARGPVAAGGRLDRRGVQRLQGLVGNAAVSRLVAQRFTEPVSTPAQSAPGFRAVSADVAGKREAVAAHPAAEGESRAAQDAAVAPPDDREAQGKVANAEKMNAAKPGDFDKEAFIAAVDKAIAEQAPKNLDDADKFAKSGKADKVKGEVDGKVGDGKKASAGDIEEATGAPPDTSAATEKQVTPMTPDRPPSAPGAPDAEQAVPAAQPASVTDFSQGPRANDEAMAQGEVTEEQLRKGNEPEFDQALASKKDAEKQSAAAPGQARAAEGRERAAAKAHAATAGGRAMADLAATRAAGGKAVDGGKGEAKSKDERKRAEVTGKLQRVFDATKKDVESILAGLDKKVDEQFTAGEKAARDAFMADQARRMKAYKDKRYSGWTGKAKWVKDKFAGLPKEADDLYRLSRELYVSRMRAVISSVADTIGAELGRAKARIARGRADLKAEVDRLPADLKAFGQEAARDFAGKFDDLEQEVKDKSSQLVTDLATKYTQALNKIDEEIKKLQDANRGLIAKAKDAIVGAIKTINELKNLLLGILAKAASVVMKIVKDPIGFLGNLVGAVGAGLQLFIANIADHLKKGLVSWLLGTAVKAGLDLPQRFDLKGIIHLIGSLLGLTWANIRARVVGKGVPEKAMSTVESSVPVAQSLAREGPAGAVKEIEKDAGDLKASILGQLTSYLIPTVLIAGITWIVSLLNPASAFVRAVKGIIDIVTFIVNQGAQIVEFVNAVLDAVIEIANGGRAGVPKMVETALAASIPLLIGFLASLLGIGGLAAKVKSVFHTVSRPVNRAVERIVGFLVRKGKALWKKGGEKASQRREKPGKVPAGSFSIKRSFSMHGEAHVISARALRGQVETTMASDEPQRLKQLINHFRLDPTGSLVGDVSAAVREESEGCKRRDVFADLDVVMASLIQAEDYAKKASEAPGERERQDFYMHAEEHYGAVAQGLIEIGKKYKLTNLEKWTKKGHQSNYVEFGKIKEGVRKDARLLFYGSYTVEARDLLGVKLLEYRRAKKDREGEWLASNPVLYRDSRSYVCPRCNELRLHVLNTKQDLTRDHLRPIANHWNGDGRFGKQPPRVAFNSLISNMECVCRSCNSSKGSDNERFEWEVGPDFRGPKDAP